ncbi:MAG: LytR cell envelope-related transcriptional attenuator [Actinomycetota bacterium]|jgi:hypothetical protein
MTGRQTFHQRVTTPLVVILTTVFGLFFVGNKLWKAGSDPVAEPVVEVSATSAPINPVPGPSTDASVDPNLDVIGRLPVLVFNGTETPGLAKSMSDELAIADWVVEETGNWTGKPVTETTIFYPADGLSSAEELATQTGGILVEASAEMSKTALTLVIFK